MSYNQYVAKVKAYFRDIKKALSETEINNYFSEEETINELKEAYKVYSEEPKISAPSSVANDLAMLY